MGVNEYIDKVNDIDNQIAELQRRRSTVIGEMVLTHHPLHAGDTAIVNVFSYKGKPMMVDSVGVYNTWNGFEWYATGRVLKKNGEPGMNEGKWIQKVACKTI